MHFPDSPGRLGRPLTWWLFSGCSIALSPSVNFYWYCRDRCFLFPPISSISVCPSFAFLASWLRHCLLFCIFTCFTQVVLGGYFLLRSAQMCCWRYRRMAGALKFTQLSWHLFPKVSLWSTWRRSVFLKWSVFLLVYRMPFFNTGVCISVFSFCSSSGLICSRLLSLGGYSDVISANCSLSSRLRSMSTGLSGCLAISFIIPALSLT